MKWSLGSRRNLTFVIKNVTIQYQIDLNTTKDHQSSMVSRILLLIVC